MKNVKSIMLSVVVFTQTTSSQNNNHKYYLEGNICGGVQKNYPVTGIGGAFGFFISSNSSIDLRTREVYSFQNKTIIGAITVNYRYHFNNGLFVGTGFAHHHEIFEEHFLNQPAEAALGSHHEISHRSGLNFEAGYNFKSLSKKGFFSCIYPTTNVIASYMFLDRSMNPLVTINFGFRIGLNKNKP